MTRAIVIETTSKFGQAAVAEGGRVLARADFPHGLKHTATMVAEIDHLCREVGWKPRDVEAAFVSVGPGSFTGTRVGVTFAKTFAFATGAKIVAVPTPAVVAANAPAEASLVVVIVDARRGMIWAQRQDQPDKPMLATPADVLAALPLPVWLIGEGIPYHAEGLAGVEGVHLCDPDSAWPKVEVVAELGENMARRDQWADPRTLTPVYVRRPEAEEKRLGLTSG